MNVVKYSRKIFAFIRMTICKLVKLHTYLWPVRLRLPYSISYRAGGVSWETVITQTVAAGLVHLLPVRSRR